MKFPDRLRVSSNNSDSPRIGYKKWLILEIIRKQEKTVLLWVDNPFKLWSLEAVLKVSAKEYIEIGQTINDMGIIMVLHEADEGVPLNDGDRNQLKTLLINLKSKCDQLGLTHSSGNLGRAINDLPQNHRELNIYTDGVKEEIENHLFLFVPHHRAGYYDRDDSTGSALIAHFPQASRELLHAGNCFAVGEYTACVFHSMRAIELGLRAMAAALNVMLPHPIELAEWAVLIKHIDVKIKEMQELPRGADKDEKVTFYANAASQFRYFRDAYRHHVAHARETYGEDQARSILDRTKEFLESLAPKLSEPDIP